MNNREKGYFYEEKAAELLKNKNYILLEKNYYSKKGEIDLIAKKNNLIVFIEVKYRSSGNFGTAFEAVGKWKLKRMYKTAQKYIQSKNYKELNYRFDLIIFEKDKIQWIENILWEDEIGY
ncbi:MAG: YraN family protein [Fusobacteriaceae bacterium]